VLNLEQLVFCVNYLNDTRNFEKTVAAINRDKEWIQEEGFSYHTLEGRKLQGLVWHDMPALFHESGAETEIVRVEGVIPPHFHSKHDAVAVCKGIAGLRNASWPLVWNPWQGNGHGDWIRVCKEQVLLIPRGTVHGFSAKWSAGDMSPLYLLIVNNRPFEDGDVQYVDIN
jgi:hypothetical protein